MPNQNVPNLKKLPENDSIEFDDSLIGFHMQAGLVDKSWILFDSGACANCCPEWFAPDYPTLPLNESAPHCGACLERHWMCKDGRLCILIVVMAIR